MCRCAFQCLILCSVSRYPSSLISCTFSWLPAGYCHYWRITTYYLLGRLDAGGSGSGGGDGVCVSADRHSHCPLSVSGPVATLHEYGASHVRQQWTGSWNDIDSNYDTDHNSLVFVSSLLVAVSPTLLPVHSGGRTASRFLLFLFFFTQLPQYKSVSRAFALGSK